MNSKIFPIRNLAACVYKWSWNTFRLFNGTSSSCHRVAASYVSPDNFDNFHNMPSVIDDRHKMLNGEWPDSGKGCEYCKNIEDAGGVSDRTYHNNIPGLTPIDFDADNNQHVTPRVVEVYLNNTCNLACVYCRPEFSSKINDELKKYGKSLVGFEYLTPSIDQNKYLELYLQWLDQNYLKIGRLSIQGGEPLLQKDLWTFLDFLDNREHPELELAINTNLNSDLTLVKKFVNRSKSLLLKRKIKRVDINCSLDNWGPAAEFIRFGLDVSTWQQNFEYIIQNKWLYINVHHVVTSLSIYTLKELQTRITEYKKINPKITQSYHFVDSDRTEIYDPRIFGGEFYKDLLDDLIKTYPITTEWDNEAKKRLIGISKLITNGKIDIPMLIKLKYTLDELDLRRKTNWKNIFPHINNFFIQHKI